MREIKVHLELDTIASDTRYHLGFFDIDFSDGNLIFKVFAQPCSEADCFCDDFRMDFETEGTTLSAWFTGHRQWLDQNHKPIADELHHIFHIIEETDMFQERYQHLAYLRRRHILTKAHRNQTPFQMLIPTTLAPTNDRGLGQVAIAHKGAEIAHTWDISFCGDSECYCMNLFVTLTQGKTTWSLILDTKNQWSATSDDLPATLLRKMGHRFKKLKKFWALVEVFRAERRLENYHRFVHNYPTHPSPNA